MRTFPLPVALGFRKLLVRYAPGGGGVKGARGRRTLSSGRKTRTRNVGRSFRPAGGHCGHQAERSPFRRGIPESRPPASNVRPPGPRRVEKFGNRPGGSENANRNFRSPDMARRRTDARRSLARRSDGRNRPVRRTEGGVVADVPSRPLTRLLCRAWKTANFSSREHGSPRVRRTAPRQPDIPFSFRSPCATPQALPTGGRGAERKWRSANASSRRKIDGGHVAVLKHRRSNAHGQRMARRNLSIPEKTDRAVRTLLCPVITNPLLD